MAFTAQRDRADGWGLSILLRRADGSGEPQVLPTPDRARLCDWSRDGKYLFYELLNPDASGDLWGSSGKWGGGTWFGGFRIPNLVPRSLVNIVGCSSRGRGNCGKLRATSNWASKPVIRSFPSAVRTVEKQLRALASSPPELLVFPRFA